MCVWENWDLNLCNLWESGVDFPCVSPGPLKDCRAEISHFDSFLSGPLHQGWDWGVLWGLSMPGDQKGILGSSVVALGAGMGSCLMSCGVIPGTGSWSNDAFASLLARVSLMTALGLSPCSWACPVGT